MKGPNKMTMNFDGANPWPMKNIYKGVYIKPFKCQPHKMVKHTQTIRRLLPTNCLSVFDHFVELALKELRELRKETPNNVIF